MSKHIEPKVPGLVLDSFDPRDVWEDEVLSGEDINLPAHYRIDGLQYDYQGVYPFCVSFATTTLIEYLHKINTGGERLQFSQPHLFFHSGGSTRGSSFRSNLNVARKNGVISYSKMPLPEPITELMPDWVNKLRAIADGIPFKDSAKVSGYVRIGNRPDELKKAIMKYGPLLVGVKTKGDYYTNNKHKRYPGADNHAVLLVGWETDGSWIIFDSLNYVRKHSGYRELHSTYDFPSAYAITELPRNWRRTRDKERKKGFTHCLNHYGKNRVFRLEQEVALQLAKEFEKFDNQSVWEAAGKFWTVYINAVAYGGYNISYKKWGMWQPGDVINDCYHWRRTGEHIFDFNKERIEHR